MDSRDVASESPERTARPWWILFVLAGVALVVVATFLVVGGPARVFTSTPTFTSLGDHHDARISGTVAYERVGIVTAQGKEDCFDVVAAGGGVAHELFCVPWRRSPVKEAALVWLSDGHLEVTSRDANKWMKVVDVATGAVSDVTWRPPSDTTSDVGPQGQVVSSHVFLGTLTLSLTSGSTKRTLLSVAVPTEYSMGDPAWSPNGRWFVLVDSVGRVLVVTTGASPSVGYLVDGASPAATDAVFAGVTPPKG